MNTKKRKAPNRTPNQVGLFCRIPKDLMIEIKYHLLEHDESLATFVMRALINQLVTEYTLQGKKFK